MEELEKVDDKRTLSFYEKALLREQKLYEKKLYERLRFDVALTEEKSTELSSKYKKTSKLAEAVRKGENFGIKDAETLQRLKVLALSS